MGLPNLAAKVGFTELGGESWADQFATGFPLVGAASEGGVYRTERDILLPISESEILEGAPGDAKLGCRQESRPAIPNYGMRNVSECGRLGSNIRKSPCEMLSAQERGGHSAVIPLVGLERLKGLNSGGWTLPNNDRPTK